MHSLMLSSMHDGPVMSCEPGPNAFLKPTPSLPSSGYIGGLVIEKLSSSEGLDEDADRISMSEHCTKFSVLGQMWSATQSQRKIALPAGRLAGISMFHDVYFLQSGMLAIFTNFCWLRGLSRS